LASLHLGKLVQRDGVVCRYTILNLEPDALDRLSDQAFDPQMGARALKRYGCAIHPYVLMTNHLHLLATPRTSGSISRLLQCVGRRYVPYSNHTYGRSGTLWEGWNGC